MKIFLKHEIALEGKLIPAGTEVTDWDESRLRPLRRAGMVRSDDSEVAKQPTGTPATKPPSSTESPGDVDSSDADSSGPGPDDDVSLESLQLAKNVLKAFASEGVTTLGEAETYYAKNGSFAPLKGIAEKTSDELAVQFGLQPPSPDDDDATNS